MFVHDKEQEEVVLEQLIALLEKMDKKLNFQKNVDKSI